VENTCGAQSGSKAQFGQDFLRSIDVLAPDKPVIRLAVASLKDPLGRDASPQAIGQAAFARDHDGENSLLFIAQAVHFAESSRQVWQMLQHVNLQDAVKEAVQELMPLLTVSDQDLDAWKALAQARGYVAPATPGRSSWLPVPV